MALVETLLGCPLQQITRAYWAVRLAHGEWLCEARVTTDFARGTERFFDWSNDLVATGDATRITELWLLCPPSRTSPLGTTARLVIDEPGTAFQFKVATVDSTLVATSQRVAAHIIGKVTDKLTGNCDCYIWDVAQDGLCTPETLIRDPQTGDPARDAVGALRYAGKTSVYAFHSWDPGRIAPLGRLALADLGVCL